MATSRNTCMQVSGKMMRLLQAWHFTHVWYFTPFYTFLLFHISPWSSSCFIVAHIATLSETNASNWRWGLSRVPLFFIVLLDPSIIISELIGGLFFALFSYGRGFISSITIFGVIFFVLKNNLIVFVNRCFFSNFLWNTNTITNTRFLGSYA